MPTLTELPPELLVSILLEPQLDYKDLKCISRVCKTLHAIEQDSQLDTKLFRKGFPLDDGDQVKEKIVKIKPGSRIELHPMLEYVDFMPFSTDEFQPMFGRGRYHPSKSSKMIDLPCMDEFMENLRGTLNQMEEEEEEDSSDDDWFRQHLKESLMILEMGEPLTRRQTILSPIFMTGLYQVEALGDDSVEFTASWEGGY
ncbi:hypothetical protein JCM3765_005490 [Sporobolomyces pararoseus]